MGDTRLVKLEQGSSKLLEDVSNDNVILAFSLVEEVNELNTLDKFHDEERDISLLSIALGPDRVFLEFISFWDSID